MRHFQRPRMPYRTRNPYPASMVYTMLAIAKAKDGRR